MTVNTHNGLFSNAGYGGGMFNGNVAFGEYSGHHYGDVSNLNAPYDNVSLQGLGADETAPASIALTAADFPWMVESAPTKQLQKSLNAKLSSGGYNLLLEDGKLGPRTCGAANFYGMLGEAYGSCDSHTSEFIAPVKATASVPAVVAPLQEEESGVPMWLWAVLAGSAAVGAAIYLKKKKRG